MENSPSVEGKVSIDTAHSLNNIEMVFNSVLNNKQRRILLYLHRDSEIIILPFILLGFIREDMEDK